MHILSSKRNDAIHQVETELKSLRALTDPRYEEIIGIKRRSILRQMLEHMTQLQKKLVNNTFEISIVGLEKSGKSTFANAFMGIDILPTKDARCTYTATSIRYGENDSADAVFYSDSEFNDEFFNKLQLLRIDLTEYPVQWTEWSAEMLQKIADENPSLSNDQKNILRDIEEILENRSSLITLIGEKIMHFSAEELETEIKAYIEDPSKALAVKSITIYSSRLAKNAIIYDVPGFDSPTRLHKDQTRAWMKRSDAVILIVNADRPSFNDSLVQFFSTVDKDDDGIAIGEKLFIFANRADIASTLEDNMKKIRDELVRYNIIPAALIDKRILAGSAKVKIDAEKSGDRSGYQILQAKGLAAGDGIDEMRSMLDLYNDTVRVQTMQHRIERQHQKLLEIFAEIKEENQIQDQETFENEFQQQKDDMMLTAKDQIIDELSKYMDHIRETCRKEKPITTKMRQCIAELITSERYAITEEELQKAKYQENTYSGTILTPEYDVRGAKYKKMYDEFMDHIVNLAVEEYRDSKNALLEAFNKGLGITSAHPCYEQLEEAIKKYIAERCRNSAPEGYYSSLIRRYSGNLFYVLIRQPFSEDSRYDEFDRERRNFYSLSLFGADDESLTVRPDVQPMHAQILYHEQLDLINNDNCDDLILQQMIMMSESKIMEPVAVRSELYQLLEKLLNENPDDALKILSGYLNDIQQNVHIDDGLPLFAVIPNPRREELIEKLKSGHTSAASAETISASMVSRAYYNDYFNEYRKSKNKDTASIIEDFKIDLKILSTILNQQVMNAIAIEVPFLDLVEQNITTLKTALQSLSTFMTFFRENESILMKEESDRLRIEKELKQKRAEILKEIEQIVDMKGEA